MTWLKEGFRFDAAGWDLFAILVKLYENLGYLVVFGTWYGVYCLGHPWCHYPCSAVALMATEY